MANKPNIKFHFGRKVWESILKDTLDDYDIQYKHGPFLLKEEKLKTRDHRYCTNHGYIDDENGIIVINYNLPKYERKITLNHELIHGKFPKLSEQSVENLAITLFEKYGIGYDFYRKEKKTKRSKK